jgi:serine/threonine protein kinase
MTLRPLAIGRYQVQRVLGQGAMGTVYLATDPRLMRPVAVKVLRDPGQDQSQILARFQREAVVSAKLNHPHVITVFDVGEDPQNGPFMAMEYVDGVTLASLIHEGLASEQCLRLLAQTMSALVAAEGAGVAHRDVKPENILVSKDWRVKLMDFGIARSDGVRITQGGRLFGTPFYTAPEVLAGGEATCITDRYSFAVTAFEALFGTLPFQGASIGAVVYAIVHDPPLFPDSMEPSLRFVFEQALAKEPEARFPDLFSFMDALIETVPVPDESRSRLRHYVSEIRAHTQAPPMGVTQSLEDRKDIHNRPTAPADTSLSLKETLELPPLDDDIFEGPSWQTVVIPASSIPTFTSPAGESPRRKPLQAERPPAATPIPVLQDPPPPATKADTRPVPVLRPDHALLQEERRTPEPDLSTPLESPDIGATRPIPVVSTPPPAPRPQQPVTPRIPIPKNAKRFLYLGGEAFWSWDFWPWLQA